MWPATGDLYGGGKFCGAVKRGEPAPEALADSAGGIMPDTVRDRVRDRWRASGLSQAELPFATGKTHEASQLTPD